MVKFKGINHLSMVTGDMDSTIRFWRDLLGMRLVIGWGKPGYRIYFFEISDYDRIAFFEWPGVKPIQEKDAGVAVKGPVAFDHVSFGLETEDELWILKDKLDAAGLWASEVIDHGFIHSIYTFDPNGIALEFSHNIEGIRVHENPIMADSSPSLITLEGSEPQVDKWPLAEKITLPEERMIYPGFGSEMVQQMYKGGKKTGD
jgi:catechol 2,3-dioxygenase-like lactoylglutathione lyase family enzyme